MSRLQAALPWLAVLAYFGAVLVWLGADPRVARDAFPTYSALRTADDGLSLAHAYLREHRAEVGSTAAVGILTTTIEAAELETNAVVLRIAPDAASFLGKLFEDIDERRREFGERFPTPDRSKPDPDATGPAEGEPTVTPTPTPTPEPTPPPIRRTTILTEAEEAWIRRGGRLVVAISSNHGPLEAVPTSATEVERVYPLWPGVRELVPPTIRGLTGLALAGTHALFVADNLPVLSRTRLGAGDLLLLSAPELFTNIHLGAFDHLELLSALAGDQRPVYFDEHAHGGGRELGLVGLLRRWHLGPLLALALIATAAWIWRGGRSVGPADEGFRDARDEAVDLVDSLGLLYDRSLDRRASVALFYKSLRTAAAAQTGLRGDALSQRVHDLTGGLKPPTMPTAKRHSKDIGLKLFNRYLSGINQALGRLVHVDRS